MSLSKLDNLIRMANQIRANMDQAHNDELTAGVVADHLTRFWSRPMKNMIIEYNDTDGERLDPVTKTAIAQLSR